MVWNEMSPINLMEGLAGLRTFPFSSLSQRVISTFPHAPKSILTIPSLFEKNL
jgi:hypothetical protein